MRIRSIKIDDYRIFKDAVIGSEKSKIGKGMVVIGGFNRSGKSTFLEIMSSFAWGFPKKKVGSVLEKHRMSCKVEPADGENEIEVMLAEDSKPVVIDSKNNIGNITMEELYPIDKFAYQNLFCLNLERLQKTHSEMDGKEREKLQALLLGAGLSDYVRIPALIKEFGKNVVGMAGELNRPDVKTLGKYYNDIQRGIKLKERALGQIDDYMEKKIELDKIDIEIKKIEQTINNLKDDAEKYQIIQGDYKEYSGSIENIAALTERIAEKSRRADTEKLRDLLSRNENTIRKFKDEVSGFKARIIENIKKKNELGEEKSKIQAIIRRADCEWDLNKWDQIRSISIDETREVALNEALAESAKLEKESEALKQKRLAIESQINNTKTRLDKFASAGKNKLLGYLLLQMALLIPSAVIVGVFVNTVLGIIIGAICLLATLILGFFLLESKRYGEMAVSDEAHLGELELERDTADALTGEADSKIKQVKSETDNFRKQLKLHPEASFETIRRRFDTLKNIQEKINDYENLCLKAEAYENSILSDLDCYKKAFSALSESGFGEDEIYWDELTIEGEKWFDCLELLKELKNNEGKKNLLKNKLAGELGTEPERIDTKEASSNVFCEYEENLRGKYMIDESSASDLTEQLATRSEELEGKYKTIKDEQLDLKHYIETLAATEKLEQAQKQIDTARAAMQKDAEDHAVNLAARTILEEIEKEFLEKTKYEILSRAAKLFKAITGGEYKEILPPEQLTENDFQAELSSGEIQNTVDILSRGTAEQLFLAVRLSRIMDSDKKLPVIIDDSFANFDALHTNQTLKILSELSRENQIFILTCHPDLISQIGKNNKEAQYWELDKGIFRPSDSAKLYEYLSVENG